MDDKQVGTELKAALGELRNLASQLVNNSRDWLENRRQEMNHGNRQYGSQRDPRRGERENRGYGEGYATAGVNRPREEDWEDQHRNGGDDARWSSGRESDDDVRSQYGGNQYGGNQYGSGRRGGYDPGGYSQRQGGRERSGFSEYASGEREYGSAFDDSDFGGRQGRARFGEGRFGEGRFGEGRFGEARFGESRQGGSRMGGGSYNEDRDSGYYSRPGRAEGGEYSQGYGRDRDPGRAYGPEDFSQRYSQGDIFDDQGYGDAGRFNDQGRGGGDWRHRGGPTATGSWRGGERERNQRDFGGGGYGQPGAWQSGYGQQNDQRARGAGAYGGYAEGGQQSFRGRGPRGYSRSDERITEDLNEKLTDDWQLDADDIQVSVSNGVATLSGTVEQRWLKHHAEDLAGSCSGVKDVRNDIRVVGSGARDSGSGFGSSVSGGTGMGGGSGGSGTGVGGDTETGNRARGTATSATGKTGTASSTTGGTGTGGNTH